MSTGIVYYYPPRRTYCAKPYQTSALRENHPFETTARTRSLAFERITTVDIFEVGVE